MNEQLLRITAHSISLRWW